MFKRKQDVDKHVSSILSRKRDEKERNAQGFQIARLYMDIREYATSKKYLSGFLHGREKAAPQAHHLMGEIHEALGEKDAAVESYKRALDLGGFGSTNRQLILKICELYCEIGTDTQRMKYWLDKCEEVFPKNEIVFNLKSKIATTTSNGSNIGEMEDLITSELVKRPTDLSLRIRLLNLYEEGQRYEEAYNAAVSTDLTTAFVGNLHWFEVLLSVFQGYSKQVKDAMEDQMYLLHYLHILRNVAYLRLPCRDVQSCSQALERFDKTLKIASAVKIVEESWTSFLKEMRGQIYYLAGLLLLKRAHCGALSWQEGNQLSGACFLASRGVDPLDSQSLWFVKAPQNYSKFYNWWYQQSYNRLSQVGHMIQQLAQDDVVQWSKVINQQVMTAMGHQKLFKALYSLQDAEVKNEDFFLYSSEDLVTGPEDLKEPISQRQLIDIDRVASQVHLEKLSNLVWLCLQRYSSDMTAQPNYHFSLFDNLQFSTKNLDSGGGESLCQMDVLVFLIAAVRCAATAVSENIYHCEDQTGRPKLLPMALCKPLCGQEQEEWWATAFKFASNNVKTDFARLRRVLIRGIETVRLIGSHGMSVSMIGHIARSLDAKIQSLKESEYGCRCPIYELTALESRMTFYWDKAKKAIDLFQRNQNIPMPKNRLFKEVDDLHLPPSVLEQYKVEAHFALAVSAMKSGHYESAIEGFSKVRTAWAKFYTAQIYKLLGEKEAHSDDAVTNKKSEALFIKARDCLYDVKDRLAGDTSHELNARVDLELEDVESKLNNPAWEDNETSGTPFITPKKFVQAANQTNGIGRSNSTSTSFTFNTPRPQGPHASHSTPKLNSASEPSEIDADVSVSSTSENLADNPRPRPSPERLDCQIKSLSHSQSSLFKMVLDRNEELILINGKIMEELRENNAQLRAVFSENKALMEEIKNELSEQKDTMKQLKNEFTNFKSNLPSLQPPHPMPPGPIPPMFMPQQPRPPYPGMPVQGPMMPAATYSYLSPVPQLGPGTPQYRGPPGGGQSSGVGKFKNPEDDDDDDEINGVDDTAALFAEYYDPDFSQYYTPDPQIMQDWSLNSRPTVDQGPTIQMPTPAPPPLQPRMTMPAPGFFASALRGQALQYAQASQNQPSIKPMTIKPGFFSTPSTTTSQTNLGATPLSSGTTPTSQSTSLSSILTPGAVGQKSIVSGVVKSDSPAGVVPTLSTASLATSKNVSFSLGTPGISTSATPATTTKASDVKEPSKTTFAGFTFSTTPNITPTGDKERPKAEPHKATFGAAGDTPKPFTGFSLTTSSLGAGDTPKPFTGFSLTPDLTSKNAAPKSPTKPMSPGGVPKSPGGRGDEDTVEEYEPNVDFTPVIDLPDLVEKKTGEENETELLVDRCRMFRFDAETKSWKERGVGEIKILKNNDDVKFRIIMRRDQILKLCANHLLTADMKLTPMAKSDRAWCYSAHDFADEEVKVEQLAVKFKTPEKAQAFQQVFEDCLTQLKETPKEDVSAPDSSAITPESKQEALAPKSSVAAPTEVSSSSDKPLSDLFKPKVGSWECNGCMMRNEGDVLKCPACETLKPGVKPEDLPKDKPLSGLTMPSSGSGFSFGQSGAGGFSFGNQAATPAASSTQSGTGGFSFGNQAATPAAASTKSLSELFKPAADSWECDGCLVRNSGDVVKCPACNTMKPGVKPEEAPKVEPKSGLSAGAFSQGGPGTGFKFGPSPDGGFSFGNTSTAASTPPAGGFSFGAPAKTEATSAGGFSFGNAAASLSKAKDTSETKTGGFSFGNTPTTSANQAAPKFAFGQAAPGTSLFNTPGASSTPKENGTAPTIATSKANDSKPIFGVSTTSSSGFVFGSTAATTTTSGTPSVTTSGSGASVSIAPKPGLFSFGTNKELAGKKDDKANSGESGGLLAKLLTSDDSASTVKGLGASTEKPAGSSPAGAFTFGLTPKPSSSKPSLFGNTQSTSSGQSPAGFQFSLAKSPPKNQGTPAVPNTPDIDDHGMYINKEGDDSHIHFEPIVALPDKVEVKTGEEEEEVLFESRAKMYRFVSSEWKEKGVGVVKILEHKQSKKSRVLMRRDQVLKICCNHLINPNLKLEPMARTEGKAWTWFAMDFSEDEGKIEQLALRFKNADIAGKFKTVFDESKEKAAKLTPSKDQAAAEPGAATVKKELFAADSTTKEEEEEDDDVIFVGEEKSPAAKKQDNDDDVIFVREEKATAEQVDKARQYLLPDNFYLYETKPPCPGCIGCTDGEPPFKTSGQGKSVAANKNTDPAQPSAPGQSSTSLFGAAKPGTPLFGGTQGPSPAVAASNGKSKIPIFGGGQKTTTPIFGGQNNATPIFGSAQTKTPVFGSSQNNTPLFGSSQKNTPLFGSGQNNTPLFGSGQSNTPLFGSGQSNTPLFGSGQNKTSVPGVSQNNTSVPGVGQNNTPAAEAGQEKSTSLFGLGANLPNFASLTSDTEDSASKTPSMFDSKTGVDFSSLASQGQTAKVFSKQSESASPFKFAGAGQQLFGKSPGSSGTQGEGEDGTDGVAPSDDIHFEPIIPLPDLVQVKTGEEDWTAMFCQRAKLYKYDQSVKQWKERGVGEMKIMGHNKQSMFRVLQRREQVLKIACNHLITVDMKLKPLATSETSWCWLANDFTDAEGSIEHFAVKFKNKEIAQQFKDVFEQSQDTLREAASSTGDSAQANQEYDYDGADEEDEEKVIFEKRSTLSFLEDGAWKKLGMGTLQVTYNEDINGNSVSFTTDEGQTTCSHVICREHNITHDPSGRHCEWRPIDFASDEAVRKHFSAAFSSVSSADEFVKVFNEGQRLAVDSEISEIIGKEIDVPEIFSRGEPQK